MIFKLNHIAIKAHLKLPLVFLIIFLYSAAQSQITFNKTYDYQNGDESGSQVLVVEDGYIVTGNGYGYDIGNYYDQKFRYFKIDTEGHYVWKRSFGDTSYSFYSGNSCIRTLDNNVLISSGVVSEFPYNANMYILKFDPDTGDTILYKSFPSDIWQYAYSVEEFSDGTLLFNMYDHDHPFTFMKTNADGETIWKKTYGAVNEGTSSYFKMLHDTVTLLSCYNNCEEYPGFTWRDIDSSGTIIFNHYFDGICTAYGVRSSYGGILGIAPDFPFYPYASYVYRADTTGDFLWEYRSDWDVDTMYDFGFQFGPLEELENGDIILTGFYATNPLGSYRGFVAKINSEGDPYWERSYASHTDPYDDYFLTDIAPTADGGVILAGSGSNNHPEELRNIWVLKLDSMGCLTPGCDTLGLPVMEFPLNDEIILYPNPANSFFVLQSGNVVAEQTIVTLYTLTGEIVKRQVWDRGTSSLYIRINDLIPGVYVVEISSDNRTVTVQKVIVNRN